MRSFSKMLVIAAFLGAALSASAADVAVLRNGFEIRYHHREQIGPMVRLFLAATPDSGYVDIAADQIASFDHDDGPVLSVAAAPATVPAPAPNPAKPNTASEVELRQLISDASGRHQVDPDLITSVIRAESNFNPHARSPKGAQGLMQLMPGTATTLGVADAYQPDANVDAGTRYLRELLLRYDDNIAKALAAYNAGPYRVEQYRGVPPYRETHAYVARIIREFNRKKLADRRAAEVTAQKKVAEKKSPVAPAATKSVKGHKTGATTTVAGASGE